jgi:hypothetical protein
MSIVRPSRKLALFVRPTRRILSAIRCYVNHPLKTSARRWMTAALLVQLRVLGFGLLQDRDIGIGIFP